MDEAWPTIEFPLRRVNEFPSCLNQYELGFLLHVAPNILNDKADFLIIQSQMEEHFGQRELHVQDTEARQGVACSETENLVNNIAITVCSVIRVLEFWGDHFVRYIRV